MRFILNNWTKFLALAFWLLLFMINGMFALTMYRFWWASAFAAVVALVYVAVYFREIIKLSPR